MTTSMPEPKAMVDQALRAMHADADPFAGVRGKQLADAIFAPIKPLMPDAQAFLDKKLGESTGAEFLAFVTCLVYALGVGYIGANLGIAVIRAGARGPVAIRVPLQLR